MNSNKMVLIAVAIVAIGIFALPSTVSLFSGQHSWYGLNTAGNQIPCEKCHMDIQDEMKHDLNGVHTTLDAPGCDCHRVTGSALLPPDTRIGTGVASGDGGTTPGTTAHAAATIACMICHEQGTTYPFAGGFNQSAVEASAGKSSPYYYNHSDGSGGEHAAHNAFIGQAIKGDLMEDSNEACIACHTRVGVNITWTKNEYLEFIAYENETGVWNVSDFAAGGTNVTQVNSSNTWVQ